MSRLDTPGGESCSKVEAIVLAAGRSSRMGERHKVSAAVGGVSMIRRVIAATGGARLRRTLVVTGAGAELVANELAAAAVTLVHNPDYGDGLASSLRAGLLRVSPDSRGVMILLADMPFITSAHIDALLACFDPDAAADIVVPERAGSVGNPVVWSTRYLPRLMALSGDRGARALLQEFGDRVRRVPVADDAIFFDVDTPEALEAANALAAAK